MAETDKADRERKRAHATRQSALELLLSLTPEEMAELQDKADEKVIIQPKLLEGLAKLQCTIEEAAAACGVSARTMKRRLQLPVYRAAWERGKMVGRVSLRRRQFDLTGGDGSAAVSMSIHLGMQAAWLAQTARTQHEHSGPNGRPIGFNFDKERLRGLTDEQFDALEAAATALGFELFATRGPDGDDDSTQT